MNNSRYPLDASLDGFTHILLFRHGESESGPGKSEAGRSLSAAGVEAVQQVARRLAEEVAAGRSEFAIETVLHGGYTQVRESGGLIREALCAQEATAWPPDVREVKKLNPDVFWAERRSPDVSTLSRGADWARVPGKALLIIGHEPQLSEIARELQFPVPRPVAIPSGGVACFYLGGKHFWTRPSLRWVIERSHEDTTELLRSKIRSKMDVAKVFGAVITFALGIVLNILLDATKVENLAQPFWVQVAAGALGLALVLYVAVLYAYDSLLMPPRFWSTARRSGRSARRIVARPPSSMNLVMQQNMVWIWTWPFTLANVLVVIAFALIAWGGIGVSGGWVIGTTAVAAALAFWTRRIDLGVQD